MAVKATWAHRCDRYLFVSDAESGSLPAVHLAGLAEGRGQALWDKTRAAFAFVYEMHGGDYDWFMKADDDTFVVVENLRTLLADYSPDSAVWFGCQFVYFDGRVGENQFNVYCSYHSGGAGYVLSRESVRRLVTVVEGNGESPRF